MAAFAATTPCALPLFTPPDGDRLSPSCELPRWNQSAHWKTTKRKGHRGRAQLVPSPIPFLSKVFGSRQWRASWLLGLRLEDQQRPSHSCGTAPDSHRLPPSRPCTPPAGHHCQQYSVVWSSSVRRLTNLLVSIQQVLSLVKYQSRARASRKGRGQRKHPAGASPVPQK